VRSRSILRPLPMRRALLLVVPTALALGCGSGNQTVEDQAFVTRFCELTEACCQKNDDSNLDPASCKAQLQILGFSRDATLRAACLAALTQRAADVSCFPALSDLDDPCIRTFNEPGGSSPPGGPCRTTVDCAGKAGTITMCLENSSGGGFCMRMAPGQAGQGTCLGDEVTTSGGGLLGPFWGPGASGWPPTVTDGVYCDQRAGLTCFANADLDAQVCAPLLQDGSPCSFGFNCASEICWDSTYGEVNGERPGVCMARKADGQSCASANVTCDFNSYCRNAAAGNGVCAPKAPNGAPCGQGEVCESGTCLSNSTCAGMPLHARALFCH
jgi:hypothetical protein